MGGGVCPGSIKKEKRRCTRDIPSTIIRCLLDIASLVGCILLLCECAFSILLSPGQ